MTFLRKKFLANNGEAVTSWYQKKQRSSRKIGFFFAGRKMCPDRFYFVKIGFNVRTIYPRPYTFLWELWATDFHEKVSNVVGGNYFNDLCARETRKSSTAKIWIKSLRAWSFAKQLLSMNYENIKCFVWHIMDEIYLPICRAGVAFFYEDMRFRE